MSRLIALAGLAAYTVQSLVHHNGKDFGIGAPIDLEPEQAQPLLDAQVIGYAEQAKHVEALQVGDAERSYTLTGLLAERDEARQRADQLGTEVSAANATISGLRQAVDAATARADGATATATALQAQLDEAAQAKAELQAQLDEANAAKVALQAQLDARPKTTKTK